MPKSRTRASQPRPSGTKNTRRRAPAPAPDTSTNRFAVVGAVALVALVVLAGVAFLVTRSGDEDGSAVAEVSHVHGLGVDPQDGALYAGTHYGLFRIPEDGAVTRVADRVQDFMGFTVVGAGHFLASGHPGEGQDGPSSIGLIETTDGGETWQQLSLEGEADFHSLEARHGRVYGLNAMTGEFMVSEDMQTWESRSQIPMADFTVSPEDADVLLATTEQGLARSDDGGSSFSAVSGAPVLLLVSWAEDGTVIGVEPEGAVHASTDGGQTWQQRGQLDAAPHALTAAGDDQVYAAIDGAILASADGGRTFTVRYREE